MDDGYTPENVNSVLGQLSDLLPGFSIVCVWEYIDAYGYGGNSDFYVESESGEALFCIAGDLWKWLNMRPDDPGSPEAPGDPASWVGGACAEFTTADLVGDGFHNYAIQDRH
ncbi:hypothetical protein [Amycolatopsis sp. NPDC004079]|uniref:hypothetical protein n=1 Tax=Amycolatopsis sp. NPDC004079 TaxID=3154549 RepID=UPI0033B6291B